MQDVSHITEKIDCIQSLARKTFQAFVEQSIDSYSFNMDKAMKIFSSVATLFMPLTLASGIWGMNVQVPFEGITHLGPFFGILGFMVLVIIVMIIYFKKQSWM
jgi:Mg2+ and Co2+ transporter CorA